MPETIAPPVNSAPLTSLSEDEILFRDNIRQFAEERVRPLAKEMDEKGVFEKDLIHQFFQLGGAAEHSSRRSSRSKNSHAQTHRPG